ncbi:hypothetical protein SAMN02745866_01960 [Alteromonadaceae bacterium Bs31]|nr:hypothetical protein SAMN02745866_01960 [Alteromonadaceae bacterium Bs31]
MLKIVIPRYHFSLAVSPPAHFPWPPDRRLRTASCAMGHLVDLLRLHNGHMGVYLRCVDTHMPWHLLDNTDVCAVIQRLPTTHEHCAFIHTKTIKNRSMPTPRKHQISLDATPYYHSALASCVALPPAVKSMGNQWGQSH